MSTQPVAKSKNPEKVKQVSSVHFEIQPNIGKIDRYIRMTAGLFMIGSALSNQKSGTFNKTLLAVGSMSLTEGILGWCPIMAMLGIRDTTGSVGEEKSSPSGGKTSQHGAASEQEDHGQKQHDTQSANSVRRTENKWSSPSGAPDYIEPSAHQTEMSRDRKEQEPKPDDVAFALNTSFQ